ncbi:hypothetical protein Nmel_008297, partial [Mimus melanotis]
MQNGVQKLLLELAVRSWIGAPPNKEKIITPARFSIKTLAFPDGQEDSSSHRRINSTLYRNQADPNTRRRGVASLWQPTKCINSRIIIRTSVSEKMARIKISRAICNVLVQIRGIRTWKRLVWDGFRRQKDKKEEPLASPVCVGKFDVTDVDKVTTALLGEGEQHPPAAPIVPLHWGTCHRHRCPPRLQRAASRTGGSSEDETKDKAAAATVVRRTRGKAAREATEAPDSSCSSGKAQLDHNRDNPEEVANLVSRAIKTQNPDWSDLNVMLDTLLDETEKRCCYFIQENYGETPKEVEDVVIPIVWANDFPGTSKRAEPVSITLKLGTTQ